MELGLWTYILAITVLTLTPGVDTLLVVRNAARGGWKDGAFSSLGICSGLFIHAFVSAVGISVILLQTAWAFNALKLTGACYLIWLGVGSFRRALRRRTSSDTIQVTSDAAQVTSRQPFSVALSLREGLLSNVLNPKTVIFYMAFLPQFINPSESAMTQSLFLALVHFVIAMVWQCSLALIVVRAKKSLSAPSVGRFFDGITGVLFIGLGLKLAVGGR